MEQERQGIWIARDKNGEIHGFITSMQENPLIFS